jgi:hypothetical protein
MIHLLLWAMGFLAVVYMIGMVLAAAREALFHWDIFSRIGWDMVFWMALLWPLTAWDLWKRFYRDQRNGRAYQSTRVKGRKYKNKKVKL